MNGTENGQTADTGKGSQQNSESEYTASYQEQASDWARLAQQDPDAFEAMRAALLDEFIRNSPPHIQRRLEGIQWKVDLIRERAESPAEVLAGISEMMWESAEHLRQKHLELVDLCSGKKSDSSTVQKSAQILNFSQVSRKH